MATLVRPPALHVRAVSGGGNKDRVAPQRPWWGGNKPISPRQSGGSGARGGAGGGGVALDQVLGVLRRDGEFVQAAVGAPLRDVFWLRFLEKKQRKQQQPRPKHKPFRQQQEEEEVVVVDESPPAFPPPSYPSGSSPATTAHLNSTPLRAHPLADGHIYPGFGRVVVRGANGGRLPGPQGVRR
jgi:aarF domain-containing kinase